MRFSSSTVFTGFHNTDLIQTLDDKLNGRLMNHFELAHALNFQHFLKINYLLLRINCVRIIKFEKILCKLQSLLFSKAINRYLERFSNILDLFAVFLLH